MATTPKTSTVTEITVVDCDDWLGLYVDGELALEGHGRSQHADILAFGAKHSPYSVRCIFADEQWMQDVVQISGMPQSLSAVIGREQDPRAELAAQ
jgi:hypothetical protein